MCPFLWFFGEFLSENGPYWLLEFKYQTREEAGPENLNAASKLDQLVDERHKGMNSVKRGYETKKQGGRISACEKYFTFPSLQKEVSLKVAMNHSRSQHPMT